MSRTIFYLLVVVQVYGRAEGFEHYFESIFGPNRPFNSKKLQDQIPKLRWARNAPSAEAIKSKIEGADDVIRNNFENPKVCNHLTVVLRSIMIFMTAIGIFGNEDFRKRFDIRIASGNG